MDADLMAKTKRTITPEQKAKMLAGQQAARERRAAAATAPLGLGVIDDADEELLRQPVAAIDPEAAAARRHRLLGDLDAETAALFTDEELEKIEVEERAKALAEQKKQAMADVRAVARQRARVEHDLIAPSVLRSEAERRRLAEPVTFRVSLPGDGAGHTGQNGFRVDGRLYQDGQTYTEPRAIFESLLSNHYRARLNEVQFKTLDQHKAGGSAREVLAQTLPSFEVNRAA